MSAWAKKTWWTCVLHGPACSQSAQSAQSAPRMHANLRSLTLHLSALLLRLIKAAAAALDACLKPGHETRNRSSMCNWCPALFSRPLPEMSTSGGTVAAAALSGTWCHNLWFSVAESPNSDLEAKERIVFESSWTRELQICLFLKNDFCKLKPHNQILLMGGKQSILLSGPTRVILKDCIYLEIKRIKTITITTTTTTKRTLEIGAKAIKRKSSNQSQLSEPKIKQNK